MLPATYALPAGLILLVAGLVACFAGYRLFRVVLGVYGFILGALFASSMAAPSNQLAMIVAAVVGGLIGALILVLAYFAGVVLVGAALGAAVAHVLWAQFGAYPHPFFVIVFGIAGGALAWVFQRYVIIVATAFGGAWTALTGGLTVAGLRVARRVPEEVWMGYPPGPQPGRRWVMVGWIVLGIIGALVQIKSTSGARRRR
jgi:hypothetical protein